MMIQDKKFTFRNFTNCCYSADINTTTTTLELLSAPQLVPELQVFSTPDPPLDKPSTRPDYDLTFSSSTASPTTSISSTTASSTTSGTASTNITTSDATMTTRSARGLFLFLLLSSQEKIVTDYQSVLMAGSYSLATATAGTPHLSPGLMPVRAALRNILYDHSQP